MKILFTSVGRRVELMQCFQQAAERLGMKDEVTLVGADITDTAPALYFCHETKLVCRISDPRYLDQLLSICEQERIDALIPTIDTDLLLLSKNKDRFAAIGTKVLIADYDKVRLCRDKNLTADYFESLGLHSPQPVHDVNLYLERVRSGKAHFPAFIKPKDGSSSIDAYRVDDEESLRAMADRIGDYIIQPYVTGREYTVDIFCDLDGDPVLITPRERNAVRSGEVLKTTITQDDRMIGEMKTLVADFKPVGQITVQLIRDENTGIDQYIEINPRFGGGAPLSIKAGADSAEMVIRMLKGEKLSYVEKAARDGECYSRFDQSICVRKGKRL